MNIVSFKERFSSFKEKFLEFLKKNKKKIFIYTPLSFLTIFILSLILWFGPTVGFILTVVLKPAFSIGDIYFPADGEVVAKRVKLSYKRQVIVDAPKVILKYDLNGKVKDWIKAIDVYDSKIVIDRKGSSVNIVDAFSTGAPGKAGTGVPIGIIRAINADAIYRDFSYEIPIEKHVPVVNGYVSFDEKKGIDLIFGGPFKDGEISYSFTNYIESYAMTIKGKNLDVDTNLLQYAYYYEDVNYLTGKADLDLTIAASGLYGTADIRDLQVQYKPFAEIAKNINGHVDFLKDKIKIDANFSVFGKEKKFTLDYDAENEMNINIILGDMKYEEISKYKLLSNLDLKWIFEDVKKLNVNLKLDKNKQFFVILDSVIPKVKLGVELDEVKNRLVYTNGEMNWSILDSTFLLWFLKDKFMANFKLSGDKGELTYNLNGIDGDINLDFLKDKIGINSKSGFIVGKGEYTYESKILEFYNLIKPKIESDTKGKPNQVLEKLYSVKYDFKNLNFSEFLGKLEFNISNSYNGELSGEVKDGAGKIENIILYDLENNEVLKADGEIDLKNLKYNFNFDTNTFDIAGNILDSEFKIRSNVNGSIKGVGKDYYLEVDGELNSVDYKNIHLNGLKSNFRIKNGIVEIKKIGNSILNLNGRVDLYKKDLNLEYSIKELTNQYIKLENPNFVIHDSAGNIKGKFDNPIITSSIKNGMLFFDEGNGIDFTGEVLYKNKILTLLELTLEEKKSKIYGEYNFSNNKYKVRGDILLDKASKYTLGKFFNYRVIGRFSGEGVGKKIKLNSQYTIDSFYYKGERLPDLEGKLFYNAEKISDGVLDIEYLKILKDKSSLGVLKGKMDFKNKKIKIDLNEGEVDLSKYFNNSAIKGLVHVSGDIAGNLNSPNFKLKIYTDGIKKDQWNFKEVNLSLSGNLEEIKIDKFSMLYENNLLEAMGFYRFPDKNYSFNLFSKNIEIDFLNSILKNREISGIKGKAQLDLNFTDKGNDGFFRGEGINFSFPRYLIVANDLDFSLKLSKNKVDIESLKGVLNSGDINATGYLIIPKIDEIKNNPYFYEKIDYDLSLNMKDIKYDYPEYFKMNFDTDLNIASNKLVGSFKVIEGELKKIPGVSEDINILKIITEYLRDFIFNSKVSSKDSKKIEEERRGEFGNLIETNLDLKIEKGIDVDLKSVVGIIEDVKGKFLGSGKIKGRDGKANFLGSFSIEEGSYILNNIDFAIAKANLIFSRESDYYPNYNPILVFESYSKNSYENYEISLNGELKSLNFSIKSGTGISSGNLTSLFSGEGKKNSENSSSGDQSLLVANVLNSQLTNTFIKPFSNTVKTVFGLSKLRITSDIGKIDNQSETFDDGTGRGHSDENRYKLGAKLQAEKHLYKKIYLIGEIGISGNSSSDSTRGNDESGSSFNKYDTRVEYRMTESKSIGIGVSKATEKNAETVNSSNKKDEEKPNYYINFLFYKKYESFSDMIKEIF